MHKNPLGDLGPSATLDGSKDPNTQGAVMIFANSLPGFKAFLGKSAGACSDFGHVVAFVSCILLPAVARRSVKAAARSVRGDLRDAGNLLRFLANSDSPEALLAAAQRRLLDDARGQRDRLHLLVLDSTSHTQQGKLTQNTFSCGNTRARPKNSSRRQKKTHRKSCHCFVFALLLCPGGTRIPYWLPFHTKEYCELRGWEHQTQADLAARLITDLPLPESVPLVVVGDTAFEAKQIRKACAARDARWVVPINPERVLAGVAPRPKVRSLIQGLKAQDLRRVSFRLDQGVLAPMARVSAGRVRSSKHSRTYWVHQRTERVHNVGLVTLLFSSQQEPKASGGVVVQKVLMSDAVAAGAEELLRWYALRWQVEQFFKEMKGELGMCQYKHRRFERVQGWVGLCVLSFCYLEWRRGRCLKEAGEKERPYWRSARACALRARLRREVEEADVRELVRLANGKRTKKRLTDLLRAGYDDPADPRGRRGAA
jgi:hypothetical protein